MIKIQNLEGLATAATIMGMDDATVLNLLDGIMAGAESYWRKIAGEELFSSRADYLAGIQPYEIRGNVGVLALVAILALALALRNRGNGETVTVSAPPGQVPMEVQAADLASAKQSTVLLLSDQGLGSGFFVADNLIVTNQHVAALSSALQVAVSREADDPAEQEGGAVRAGPGRREHEHDADDRDRADRHADREREGLTDRLTEHRRQSSPPAG